MRTVFGNLSKINKKVSHIFMDPPYIFKDYKKVLYEIENNNIMNNNGIIIIEMRNKSRIHLLIMFIIIVIAGKKAIQRFFF
ncbi:MAG: hypothetical protein CM1200mP33_1350 [Chloroflexota bacterium]|nr:MAG: hypothetical protein CM1200mP33_1350 [Chloroflexota bacterium]